jgi:all-trans-retinol 13,14-reductase
VKRTALLLMIISTFTLSSCKSDTDMSDVDYEVIVIGAGGGGLAAATRLSLAGKKVLLVEQHSKVGGYMSSFERGDYTFEVSLHAINGLDPEKGSLVPLLKDLRIYDKIKPTRLDPMYKAYYDGFSMVVPADAEAYRDMLIERFPHEEEGIDGFYTAIGHLLTVMDANSLITSGEYISGIWKIVSNPRAMFTVISCTNLTMGEFLDKFFADKALLSVMASYTGMLGDGPENIAGMVFAGMWAAYHQNGCYYLEGGSQSISSALEEVTRQNGGEILLSTRVTKILIEDGRAAGVTTSEGKTFRSRYVISNANALDTFFKLVGREHLPAEYLDDLEKMEVGGATFTVYMGVDKDYREYFPGNTHTLIVMPSLDTEENFRPMREGDITRVMFGIANYTKTDPGNAPEGKNVICLVTLMPYDWNDGWKEKESHETYTKLKTEIAMKFVKRAEEYLPGLSSHIEEMEVGTPRTNEHYTSNAKGSIYGWAHTAEQSMQNRLPQETPIENLFLAGAWTIPGGGQAPVLISGNSAAEKILEEMN